ncbi:MAG: hypothetical protein U0930_15145 [Pirellulales bacterium]
MKCSAVSRLIVKLREEGESQESIAAMLGITRNKVRSYIAEAKEVLTIELDLECWDTESSSKFYQKPAEDHSMSGVACNRPRWSSKQGNNGGENHAHLPSNARAALLDLPRK